MALYSYRWDWIFSIPFFMAVFSYDYFPVFKSCGAHHSSSVYYKNCTGGKKKMNRRVTMEVTRPKAQILIPQKMYQTGEIQRIRKMRRQIYRKDTKKKECSR